MKDERIVEELAGQLAKLAPYQDQIGKLESALQATQAELQRLRAEHQAASNQAIGIARLLGWGTPEQINKAIAENQRGLADAMKGATGETPAPQPNGADPENRIAGKLGKESEG